MKLTEKAPKTFKWMTTKGSEFVEGMAYTIQVAPEDCTGCGMCVDVCPAKNKKETRLKALNMVPQIPIRATERENYKFFLDLPEYDRRLVRMSSIKANQLLQPLFEYSGACSGCGETPYVKLMTQLFGDRAIIANATGCSSIYGGNLPTTPYTTNKDGRGPAWCNSLFEDNAEFGLGYRLTIDKHTEMARELVQKLAAEIGGELASGILKADQSDEAGIYDQRERVAALRKKLAGVEIAGSPQPAEHGRLSGEEKRLDRRRRRLGLRHRLRRPGSRPGFGAQRQPPRARHRGLLQHRRTDVEVHAARRSGQVRRRRQAGGQEGSRPACDQLRQRLRCHGGHGRQRRADRQGVSRSRIL